MNFRSILFIGNDKVQEKEPEFFNDLNIDKIVYAVTASKEEYNLKPFFYTKLNNLDEISYRQEVMMEIENKSLFENLILFAEKMRTVRRYLAMIDKLHYKENKEGWFIETVKVYCEAVEGLSGDLSALDLSSRGLLSFRQYLNDYLKSKRYITLTAETGKIREELASVEYCQLINGNNVKVIKYQSEADYSIEVENVFQKFKQGAVKDYKVKFPSDSGMNHVEAKILELVAKLYPAIFSGLTDYCTKNKDFMDDAITVFDREVQFYIAYLEYIEKLKQIGLKFCYPDLSDSDKEVFDKEGFDLALASKLINNNTTVICNDFYLAGEERILAVSGPNQGGKTTFARMFGQLHYLANIGCPVPGREARLYLYDFIFTHFEKEEVLNNLQGKLKDDLMRIHNILEHATSDSIVIINEIFSSTTSYDAAFLGKMILEKIDRLDLLGVYVTFIDELTSLSNKIVSMVSTVVAGNPSERSFKIVRKPADGLAYAISIAEKYDLIYDRLKERIES